MSDETKNNGMSRRGFLKRSALTMAGVVSSGFLISGCGKGRTKDEKAAQEAAKNAGASQEPAFLKAPEPIKDSDIKGTEEYDVVVVGGALPDFPQRFPQPKTEQKLL